MNSHGGWFRVTAAASICEIDSNDSEAYRVLLNELCDVDSDRRSDAAWALDMLPVRKVVGSLKLDKALNDWDPGVQAAARRIIDGQRPPKN